MKRAGLLTALTLCLTPLGAAAQIPAPHAVDNAATLLVSGDAVIERSPDVARANVEIVTNDDDAARSAGKNTDVYNALKTKLAALAIGADALQTTYFVVNYVPHPPKGLPPEQRQPRYGYVTTRYIAIAVAPIEKVGKVVDAATAAGVTQVGNVSFDLKDRKAAFREALASAMGDAKRNAAALAADGSLRIVRIKSVSAGGSPQLRPLQSGRMSVELAAPAAAPPPTDFGSNGPISISAHVDVTYEIK